MTPLGHDVVPTRSRLLELSQEQRLVREGFELLDQKRILLAAETLRWLARHEELQRTLRAVLDRATVALAEAVAFNGTEALASRSPGPRTPRVTLVSRALFAVPLVEAETSWDVDPEGPTEPDRNPETKRCRAAFSELVPMLVELAAVESSLHRLTDEYRRTERKARALEEVILPEVTAAMEHVADHLDAEELEEAVRVRIRRRRSVR